jgi:hypothetical protein
MKLGRYLERVLRDLRAQLTQDGKVRLHRLIAAYLASADATQLSKGIKKLVDAHQVVVELPYAMARHPTIPPYATAKQVGHVAHLMRCPRDLVLPHDGKSLVLSHDATRLLPHDANNMPKSKPNKMPNCMPRLASHVPHALEQQEERAVEVETQVKVETQPPMHHYRMCPGMLTGTPSMAPTLPSPNLTHATAISPAVHAPAAGAMRNVASAPSVPSVQAYAASGSSKEGSGRQEDAGQKDGGREGWLWSAPWLSCASSQALRETHLSVFMTK